MGKNVGCKLGTLDSLVHDSDADVLLHFEVLAWGFIVVYLLNLRGHFFHIEVFDAPVEEFNFGRFAGDFVFF